MAMIGRGFGATGGGVGVYLDGASRTLADAGVAVHVVTAAADGSARTQRDGLRTVHRLPLLPASCGWERQVAAFAMDAAERVAALHAAGAVDVAEVAEFEAAGLALQLLGRAAGGARRCPVQVHAHCPTAELMRMSSVPASLPGASVRRIDLAERASLLLADGVVTPSASQAGWLRGPLGLPIEPAVIPLPLADPGPPPPWPEGPPEVLYAGRLEPGKGVEALVRAWPAVAEAVPGARLRMAGADTSTAPGGGSMRAHLAALLEEAGVAPPAAAFLGALPPAGLAEARARARVCVVPSLWESFSWSCAEAMAAARPVVASDTGAMRELLGGCEGGWLFASGRVEALADALRRALQETPEAAAARGRRGRERVLRRCDPAANNAQRIQRFADLVARAEVRDPRPRRLPPDRRERLREVGVALARGGDGPHPAVSADAVPPAWHGWLGVRRERAGASAAAPGSMDLPEPPTRGTAEAALVPLLLACLTGDAAEPPAFAWAAAEEDPAAADAVDLVRVLAPGLRCLHPDAAWRRFGVDAADPGAGAEPLAAARRWLGLQPPVGDPGTTDARGDAAARLGRALQDLADRGVRRVALHGAGAHTRRGAAALAEPPVRIVAVLDDDPRRAGGSLFGHPVLGPDEAVARGLMEAVVLSSDAAEEQLAAGWAQRAAPGVEVVRLYA
ncbi:putative glycosyltransferase [Phycisphaera mikurensis NBRC 102666]|uniref:Putative glycosyltransferase n=1 Tax=Phycisphaera mikurensis (strain NBRC 102666 / KCTC 22515 / FYK2301M01) TaxID=1142394 RepID=I0IHE9_PHYMF|nr:putative glycosyltransferase [Phycisphaera mikurensis NBRC 102666]